MVGIALLLLDPFVKEAGLGWMRTDPDDVVDIEGILFWNCIGAIMHGTESGRLCKVEVERLV